MSSSISKGILPGSINNGSSIKKGWLDPVNAITKIAPARPPINGAGDGTYALLFLFLILRNRIR